jgi:O-antigen ligase
MSGLGAGAAAYALLLIASALLTLRRPLYGLALLVVLDPFDWSKAVGPTTLSLPKAALLGFLLALALRRTPLAPLWGVAVRPILLGATAILIATALAASQADYLAPALRETAKAAEYLAAFAGAVVAFAADPDERVAAYAVAAGASLVAVLALGQEWTGAPSALVFGGRTFPRIAGPLEGPNQLAGYFDVALPALLAFLLSGRAARTPLAIALGLCICADALTLSRAGILAAPAACCAVVAAGASGARARRYAIAVAAAAALVFVTLSGLGLLARFETFDSPERPTGLGTRAELWHAALALWRAHPWLGVGGGNFELELPRVGVTDAQTHANSLYLQSLAEGGIVLFAATAGTLGAALVSLGRRARRSAPALAAFGATVALALHQIFDLLVFFPKVGLVWWLLLGAGAAAASRATSFTEKMNAATTAA